MAEAARSGDATTHPAALARLTTMRVGGPPADLVRAPTQTEVVEAVTETDRRGDPLLLLGGGSNLVVADAGFPGTVVHVLTRGVTVEPADAGGGVLVRVAAGEPWDDLVDRAVGERWSGIEALSGIPGSTGATPVQNVGAYGQEVAQTIAEVRVWDRDRAAVRTLAAAELGFGYRHSRLKGSMLGTGGTTPRMVVLDVLFRLQASPWSQPVAYADLARVLGVEVGERVPLADARDAVLDQRRRRGMVLDAADHDTWSCGSFFTNPRLAPGAFAAVEARIADRLGRDVSPPRYPSDGDTVKTSAAWLIERAGFAKGHGLPGPASLSTKHTLALTNRGGATASDVVALARQVRDGVETAFGVRLVNEPMLVGLTL